MPYHVKCWTIHNQKTFSVCNIFFRKKHGSWNKSKMKMFAPRSQKWTTAWNIFVGHQRETKLFKNPWVFIDFRSNSVSNNCSVHSMAWSTVNFPSWPRFLSPTWYERASWLSRNPPHWRHACSGKSFSHPTPWHPGQAPAEFWKINKSPDVTFRSWLCCDSWQGAGAGT